MTLIYTPRHMDQLVSEIKTEWAPNDPDLRRIADALRAWLREPQLRIGQFIVVALTHARTSDTADDVFRRLFYQGDSALADLVEKRYHYPEVR